MVHDPLQDASARSWAIMRRYHDRERTPASRELMVAEVQTLVGWLLELHLPAGAIEHEMLVPFGEYLVARYGHEVGPRLHAEFVEAFESAGIPLLGPSSNVCDASQPIPG